MSDEPTSAIDPALIAAAAADQEPAAPTSSPADPPTSSPAAAAPTDYLAEARDFLDFAKMLCFPIWPSLATIYDDTTTGNIARRLAAVAEKYGITGALIFGKYGAEIMLAGALVPLAIPTIQAIKHDNAQAKANVQKTPAGEAGRVEQTAGTSDAAESPLARFPDANASKT